MEELCRLCGVKSNVLIEFKKSKFNIFNLLKTHCNINLTKSKLLHEKICENCLFLLNNFLTYIDTIKSVQKIFESHISQSNSIKSCYVSLIKMQQDDLESYNIKQEPEEISDVENISDIEEIESDGSNFIIRKRKSIKRRISSPGPDIDIVLKKTKSEEDPELVLSKLKIKLEAADDNQSDRVMGSDFEPSEDEYKADSANYGDSSDSECYKPKAKPKASPVKKRGRKSKVTAPVTLFRHDWEDPFQKHFQKEIEGKPDTKPIDLDIPDHFKLPDGSVTAEAQEYFQQLGTWSHSVHLKCNRCDKTTETYLDMRKHFRLAHPVPVRCFLQLKCKICEDPPLSKDYPLICHIAREHYPHLDYTCLGCGQTFWNYVALYKHYKSVHEDLLGLLNFCLICGIHMDYRRMLPHARRHENPSSEFERIFKEHLNRDSSQHENPLGIPDSEKMKDGSISESYVQRAGFEKWTSVVMDCSLCDKGNLSILDLKKHYDEDHNDAERKTKEFKCKVERCIFARKTELIATVLTHHAKEHDRNKSLCCFICSKYFWNYVDLHTHIRQYHSEIKTIICLVCGAVATNNSQLNTHLIKHDLQGVRKHICYVCAKVFPNDNYLQTHLAEVHSLGEKGQVTYTCDICNTTMKSKYRFKYHLSTHTLDNKVYTCAECGRQCRNKVASQQHYRSHFRERRFACSFCEKKFAAKSDLTIHERLHTGDYPYECTECGQRFPAWGNMQKHAKSRHGLDIASQKAKSYRNKLANADQLENVVEVYVGT